MRPWLVSAYFPSRTHGNEPSVRQVQHECSVVKSVSRFALASADTSHAAVSDDDGSAAACGMESCFDTSHYEMRLTDHAVTLDNTPDQATLRGSGSSFCRGPHFRIWFAGATSHLRLTVDPYLQRTRAKL